MQPLISFQNISKSFKKEPILNNVQLDIFHNEIFGIVGKSGAGKTTLMRILMGFYKPDKGSLIFNGENITHKTNQIRSVIGLTTQDNSFYPKLNIAENLAYYGQMYNVSDDQLKERIPVLINLMQLNGHEKTLAQDLSGGMQRRLDFAISLIHDPDILILDEPTSGLDPILRKNIWNTIWRIKEFGKTIFVSTHFLDELERHCSRIGVLNKGRLLTVASPQYFMRLYPQHQHFAQTFEALVTYDDLQR